MNVATELSNDRLRVPPHSSEAEQALLGVLLFDATVLDRMQALRSAHFYRHEHRLIFDAIVGLVTSGAECDVVSVFEALGDNAERVGGLPYLNALAHTVSGSRSVARHALIVRDKAQLRALIAAGDEVASAAFEAPIGAVSDLVENAQAKLSAIASEATVKAPRSLAQIAVQRSQWYEDLAEGKVAPGWPTGIPRLDEMLGGGLRAGALYILAARPAVGKSSFALWIAEKMAAQGLPALVLSQEMPDTEVADRSVALTGRVDYSALTTGRLDREGWSRVSEALEHLAGLPLWLDDEPALTLHAIRAKARSVKGCKVLVLDYLQLCSGTKDDDNRNAQIEALTRGLKALAKSAGIAILALSQLNRDVEKRAIKRPQLADLRDSGAIEQDADAVLMLWLHSSHEISGHKVIGCALEKNRQGRTGTVALDFYGQHQRWGQSTESLDSAPARARSFE
jgi:replicative DNA helicase